MEVIAAIIVSYVAKIAPTTHRVVDRTKLVVFEDNACAIHVYKTVGFLV